MNKKTVIVIALVFVLVILLSYYSYPYLPSKVKIIINEPEDFTNINQEQQQKQEQSTKDQSEIDCHPIDDYASHYEYNFKDYPVAREKQKPHAPLQLTSNPIGLEYKTRITEAYKEDSDYAGHYTLIEWGCGTECQVNAVVNHWTGKIIGVLEATRVGVEYNKDSRLIVANMDIEWLDGCKNDIPSGLVRRYYTISNDGSRLIELPKKRMIKNKQSE